MSSSGKLCALAVTAAERDEAHVHREQQSLALEPLDNYRSDNARNRTRQTCRQK